MIQYTLKFGKDEKIVVKIPLERPKAKHSDSWTLLSHQQCKVCPCSPSEHKHCPAALDVETLVQKFKSQHPGTECKVYVQGRERAYMKEATIGDALQSILGLVLAESQCPVFGQFKLMGRYHLPFSSEEETMVRATSLSLLKSYLKKLSAWQNLWVAMETPQNLRKEIRRA
jgi:hypothetical protein